MGHGIVYLRYIYISALENTILDFKILECQFMTLIERDLEMVLEE
jgi:hypothetical protein